VLLQLLLQMRVRVLLLLLLRRFLRTFVLAVGILLSFKPVVGWMLLQYST